MLKNLKVKNYILIVTLFLVGILGTISIGSSFAASDNDVIHGGVSNQTDLRNKFNNGDGRNSAANIQAIFREAIGIKSSAEMSGMSWGYVYRDGRVVVDGKTVATDAKSSGRLNFRNSRPLGNTGAFYHDTDIRFSSGTNRLRALVKLDSNGKYRFAVIANCGNPVIAKPVSVSEPKPDPKPEPKPQPQASFVCDSLSAHKQQVNPGDRVVFTASSSRENTRLKDYSYDFGDGETQTTRRNMISHRYSEPGTYTAYVIVNTEAGSTKPTSICEVTIEVLAEDIPDVPEPEEPTPEPEEPEEIPEKLAETGIGSGLLGLMGSGILGATVQGFRMTRKKFLDTLIS
ncbi:MAG: PKD domain-containing protein [Candidatus Saccharimonadales bacterium]